jgi:hypothetical protein
MITVITSDNMNGTLWHSINLALIVALLVAVLAALHTSKNWTQHKQRNATVIHNAKLAKNSYTTPPIANKHSGLETQLPPATYAAYHSNLETGLRQITSRQEIQTHNSKQHIKDATPVGVVPHSPSSRHYTAQVDSDS